MGTEARGSVTFAFEDGRGPQAKENKYHPAPPATYFFHGFHFFCVLLELGNKFSAGRHHTWYQEITS